MTRRTWKVAYRHACAYRRAMSSWSKHRLIGAFAFVGLVATTFAFQPHAPSRAALTTLRDSSSPAASLTNTEQSRRTSDLPPPPCPRSNPADDLFRSIRGTWPVWFQNFLRESGLLRSVEDALILLAVPELLRTYGPHALETFVQLSKRTTKIPYGDHSMQYVDLIEPTDGSSANGGVVAFVHGGAWGSGKPWMYRLAALPFLEANQAVAMLGYRTYPDADVNGQVEDIGSALDVIARTRPDLLDDKGRIDSLVCHSSGAHIGLLHVLEAARESFAMERNATALSTTGSVVMPTSTPIGRFAGISGVYCIPSHYEYERGRGVDQLSSLRAANGPGHDGFREASPVYRLECFDGANGEEECVLLSAESDEDSREAMVLDNHVPDMLFIHGVDDNVVQYNQTNIIVDAIQSSLGEPGRCQEVLIENIGHADTVLHLMFGGVTRDFLLACPEPQNFSQTSREP